MDRGGNDDNHNEKIKVNMRWDVWPQPASDGRKCGQRAARVTYAKTGKAVASHGLRKRSEVRSPARRLVEVNKPQRYTYSVSNSDIVEKPRPLGARCKDTRP